MVRARKDYKGEGLSQKELGARVNTSQNMISLIESGEVESSHFVIPICEVLGIPPPVHYESEEQRAWSELGHVLRHKSMKKFRAALELVKTMAEDDDDVPSDSAPSTPRK